MSRWWWCAAALVAGCGDPCAASVEAIDAVYVACGEPVAYGAVETCEEAEEEAYACEADCLDDATCAQLTAEDPDGYAARQNCIERCWAGVGG